MFKFYDLNHMNLWASDFPAFEKLPRPVPTEGIALLVALVPFAHLLVATLVVSLIVPFPMLEMLPRSDAISFF